MARRAIAWRSARHASGDSPWERVRPWRPARRRVSVSAAAAAAALQGGAGRGPGGRGTGLGRGAGQVDHLVDDRRDHRAGDTGTVGASQAAASASLPVR